MISIFFSYEVTKLQDMKKILRVSWNSNINFTKVENKGLKLQKHENLGTDIAINPYL